MVYFNLHSSFIRRFLFNSFKTASQPYSKNVFYNFGYVCSCTSPKNSIFTRKNVYSTTYGLFRVSSFKFCSAENLKPPISKDKQNNSGKPGEETKQWRKMKISLVVVGSLMTFFSCYSFYMLGKPDIDESGKKISDEFTRYPIVEQWIRRFIHRLLYFKKVIQEPSQQKLLPDPLVYPYIQPPYTLVLELTDLLVHPDWTYKTGWRFKKRPHIDYFLEQIGPPLFEVVVFTAEQGITVFPIINQLDKNNVIVYKLVRDSTDFVDGHHVKNLDWLNRDLRKVIVVDWNSQSVKLHPDNALIIPRWQGNDDDQTLIDLALLLRTIAFNKIEDVREVLQYYRQFEDPIQMFRENQRKLLEQMEEQEKIELAKKKHPPLTQRFSKSYVSS